MFCPQCVENLPVGVKFCYKCGCRLNDASPTSDVSTAQTAYQQKRGRGGIILTHGILSIVMFGLLTGIPAWVMGHGDLKHIRAGNIAQSEHGLTLGGMVLGIIGTCTSAAGIMYYIFAIRAYINGHGGL